MQTVQPVQMAAAGFQKLFSICSLVQTKMLREPQANPTREQYEQGRVDPVWKQVTLPDTPSDKLPCFNSWLPRCDKVAEIEQARKRRLLRAPRIPGNSSTEYNLPSSNVYDYVDLKRLYSAFMTRISSPWFPRAQQ